jgi:hypothetical protein
MSLLGEALKRQQEEGGDELPHQTLRLKGSGSEAQSAEASTGSSQPPSVPKPQREWVAKVLVLLFILLLIGIVIVLISLLGSRDDEGPESMLIQPVERPIPLDPVAPVVEPETTEPLVEETVPDVEEVRQPIEEIVPEIVIIPPPAAPVAPVVSEPPAVVWPSIRIQAAMGSGTSGSVLIDGAIIPVGQSHKGVELLEVTPQGVRTRFQGEERTIPVRR